MNEWKELTKWLPLDGHLNISYLVAPVQTIFPEDQMVAVV